MKGKGHFLKGGGLSCLLLRDLELHRSGRHFPIPAHFHVHAPLTGGREHGAGNIDARSRHGRSKIPDVHIVLILDLQLHLRMLDRLLARVSDCDLERHVSCRLQFRCGLESNREIPVALLRREPACPTQTRQQVKHNELLHNDSLSSIALDSDTAHAGGCRDFGSPRAQLAAQLMLGMLFRSR
jgi:hypothetical protein